MCLQSNALLTDGKVRGGRKVLVRDLRVLNVAPHPRQSGTQNAVITGIRTSMYTRVLLENGIPLVHREGVHLCHHPVQHLQGGGLVEEAVPILVQLGGIRVAHKRATGCPISTGSRQAKEGGIAKGFSQLSRKHALAW